MSSDVASTRQGTGPSDPAEGGAPKGRVRRPVSAGTILARYGIQLAFLVITIALLIGSPTFRDPNNLLNILQQSSITGILACGMLVIIISGGFDLSFGAMGVASSVAAAAVIVNTGSIVLGLLAAVGIGVLAGAFNGTLITKIGITPFVATLGSTTLITGLVLTQTSGRAIAGLPPAFSEFGLGRTLGVPNPAWIFAGVALVTWVLLRTTRVGHYVYAVGSNKESARLAGVPIDRVLLVAYIFGGLCAAVAGIVLLSQTNVGQPTGTEQWALTAIAAVVVGGTPLRGGLGGVHAAILGTLLLGVVSNALNIYGVSPYWQPAVTGAVILLAVGFDSLQRKRNRVATH